MAHSTSSLSTFALTSALLSFGTAACSAAGPSTFDNQGNGGSAETSGNGGQDGDFGVDTTSGKGKGRFNGKACGTSTYGNAIPGSVLVVLDRSASMTGGEGEPEKWKPTKKALNAMMSNASPELSMGLLPFPAGKYDDSGLANCGLDLNSPKCKKIFADGGCKDVDPAPAVAIGPLGQTQALIANWLDKNGPKGNTPTLWALKTAYSVMKNIKTEGERFVLLLTDGVPTTYDPEQNVAGFKTPEANVECKELPDIEAETLAASGGSPSVKTFVIGSPGSEKAGKFLSQLAVNGLTKKAADCSTEKMSCHYQIGKDNFEQELQKVLEQITGIVSDCVFAIPEGNKMVDPNLVNVQVETAKGIIETYYDASHKDGWDYTDASKKKVHLYGPACEAYKAEKGAKVDIILGCETVVK